MSSSQEFTVVNRGKPVKATGGCSICKKNKDPSWTQHSFEQCTKVICKFCKKNGHFIATCKALADKKARDAEIERREAEKRERIARTVCNFCKENGHSIKFCDKLKEKKQREEEKQKKKDHDFPATLAAVCKSATPTKTGWAAVTKQNRSDAVVEKIAKEHTEQEQKAKEQKEKNRVAYLERVEKRKQKEEDKKVRDAAAEQHYVQEMRERFGTLWFNWVDTVEGGKYDSVIASNLRYEYEQEQIEAEEKWDADQRRRDMEMEERLDAREKEDEEMRKTLSPKAYNEWAMERQEEDWEEEDSWMEEGWSRYTQAESNYYREAPPQYLEHFAKTHQMLDWRQKILENRELSYGKK
jgi:hypothetical protein